MLSFLTTTKALMLVAAVGIAGCGATVRPGQRGLKYYPLHTPGLQKEVKPDGFYWLFPWNDVVSYDVTWQSQTEKLDILTSDVLHVTTEVTVTYRPNADRLYELHTQIGPSYYERVIRPPFLTIARSEFARHAHNDLARDGSEIEARLLGQLRETLASVPIEIDRITIRHIEYDRGLTAAISTKLATAQKVEQKEFELKIADRDAEIARVTARGRADAVRIEAEGQAAATVLKAQAQSKAQTEISRTLTPGYLRYKAFDGDATRYYFVPIGKDGLPILVSTDPHGAQRPRRE